MKAPTNIINAEQLFASNLQVGDMVHIGVVGPGQVTNDAQYLGPLLRRNEVTGIIVSIRGERVELPWGDLIELWPIPVTHGLCKGEREVLAQEASERYLGN